MSKQTKRTLTKKELVVNEARADVLKAMAHPLRLAILGSLKGRELSVNELCATTGTEISSVSRHLTVLKNAGLIEGDKRGLHVFYSLCVPCVLDFFSCIEAVLNKRQRVINEVCKN